MLKAVGVCAIILSLVLIISMTSTSFRECITTNNGNSAENSNYNSVSAIVDAIGDGRKCLYMFIHENRDDFVTIFTIVLAASTILLWVATKELAQDAADSTRRSIRAYVGIKRIDIITPNLRKNGYLIPDPIPHSFIFKDYINILICNNGKTPANNVTINLNWQSTTFGSLLGDEYGFGDFGDRIISAYFIDPGNQQIATVTLQTSRDIETIRNSIDKKTSVHFYGHIDYTDVFKTRWRRDFCFVYEPWRLDPERFTPYGPRNKEYKI